MSALRDTDMGAPYCEPVTPCEHGDESVEFKMHLNELVCICGARRRLYGSNTTWHRLGGATDYRRAEAVK